MLRRPRLLSLRTGAERSRDAGGDCEHGEHRTRDAEPTVQVDSRSR